MVMLHLNAEGKPVPLLKYSTTGTRLHDADRFIEEWNTGYG